jgi:PHP family Zn ribbon phosphoesterase
MANAKKTAKKAASKKEGGKAPTSFLFIPASRGPAYWLVHKVGCKDCRKDWLTNNSSGRSAWDSNDITTGRTVKEAVTDHIDDLVAGGHEPGSFRPEHYHINACCK